MRLIVLGLSVVAGIPAVVYCLAKSEPVKESPALEHSAPVTINVYSSDVTTSVYLTAVTNPSPKQYTSVYLRIKDPKENRNTTILVTANKKPIDNSFQQEDLYTGYYHRTVHRNNYSELLPASLFQDKKILDKPGFFLAQFDVTSIQQSGGSLFAHLPALATSDFTSSDQSPAAFPLLMTDPKGLMQFPVEKGLKYPVISNGRPSHKGSDYQSLSAGAHELYWEPSNINTEEDISYIEPSLQTSHLDSVFPSSGHIVGQSYTWRTSGSLEATLSATDNDSLASQSHYNFLSGILIGVLISAAFALIAELPEKSRLSRFRWHS